MTARTAPVRIQRVEVTAATVCRGDVLVIGGRPFIVLNATGVHGGVRLRFVSGDLLTISRSTTLTALRTDPPAIHPASFWQQHLEAER